MSNVWIVEERDDEYEWDSRGHFATLEGAKDYIRGICTPEFGQENELGTVEVTMPYQHFAIRKIELKP